MRTILAIVALLPLPVAEPATDTDRYLRPAGAGFATECEFAVRSQDGGLSIQSTTWRGTTKMVVTARYDSTLTLTGAEAVLHTGDQKKTARATVTDGKARVERDGLAAQEFDVPRGVLVTSAPDWLDVFELCRRYDREKGGKQEFAALWIHPVENCRRLTFSAERHDAETIEHTGKKVAVARYTLRIRNNSAYAAWADADGRLLKLVPLPYKEGATNWLVREGYEQSAAGLKPPTPRP